ncbi:MAG: dephospho-CoA kinase [Micromonosporaceae bacterium]|nr:dephospho-CoA kinase [Micromonosporaceae bacterium]
MLRVGLTGGIGAGKSEVARRLAGHGAVVVDADRLARDVIAPGTDGFREVVDRFGPAVLDSSGELDRDALARMVFEDEPARRRLEGLIHPRVRARTGELTAAAPPDAIVVNDVPLLVEVGLAPTYQLVMVVEAAEPVRVARLARDRAMAEDQVRARIRSQTSDPARRAAADVLLTNDGDRADLHAAVDRLWRDRLVPYEGNLRAGEPAPRSRRAALAEPDPTWPEQASRLLARIGRAAGELALRVEHVGSTSVPALAAKDVIDVQVVVGDLPTAARVAAGLREAGLVTMPGQWHDLGRDGREHRKVVACNADPGRAVNVHLREVGSAAWRDALLLRDWLRATPEAVVEYAALKRELAGQPHESIDAYASRKTPWIGSALARADRWAAGAQWRP